MSTSLVPIVQIPTSTTAYQITPAQSGTVFTIPAMAGACVISLPAEIAGLNYKFICTTGTTLGNTVDISAVKCGGVISGVAQLYVAAGGSATGIVYAANATRVRFTATAVIGDNLSVVCDGLSWKCSGSSSVVAGFAA